MTTTTIDLTDAGLEGPRHARYPGSTPFTEGALDRVLFFGRELEAAMVLHGILSERLFVLFGRSGTGKTSLLRAKVVHELRARQVWPCFVRLNQPGRDVVDQVLDQLELERNDGCELQLPIDRCERLSELLQSLRVWRDGIEMQPVIILDQFEELFTLDWPVAERARIFDDVAALVHRHRVDDVRRGDAPEVKVVLSLREDSLGELEAMASHIPEVLRHRFRLEPIARAAGRDAITAPAGIEDDRLSSDPFTFSPDALDLILDFLSEQARSDSVVAGSIEPAQLQIVCQHIETAVVPGLAGDEPIIVEPAHFGGADGLVGVLESFYMRQLEGFDDATRRRIRELCEVGLISGTGRRLSLEEGQIADEYVVPPSDLAVLIDRRLLRAERRVGSTYYELAHDSLVAPILGYRESQRDEGLGALQHQADEWEAAERPSLQLLTGDALDDAEALRARRGDEFRPIDHQFVDTSRVAQGHAEALARASRRAKRTVIIAATLLAAGAVVAYLIVLAAGSQFRETAREAERAADVAIGQAEAAENEARDQIAAAQEAEDAARDQVAAAQEAEDAARGQIAAAQEAEAAATAAIREAQAYATGVLEQALRSADAAGVTAGDEYLRTFFEGLTIQPGENAAPGSLCSEPAPVVACVSAAPIPGSTDLGADPSNVRVVGRLELTDGTTQTSDAFLVTSQFGAGRVFGYGHDGLFADDVDLEAADNRVVADRALVWVARTNRPGDCDGRRLVVAPGFERLDNLRQLTSFLADERAYTIEELDPYEPVGPQLDCASALLWGNPWDWDHPGGELLSDAGLLDVVEFVNDGGGLLLGGLGWSAVGNHDGGLTTYPAHRLAAVFGFGFTTDAYDLGGLVTLTGPQ